MKKQYSKFSIVIANYNSGKYLEDALLSVISQNYPAVELIVMDAGSTDNSVDIIRKYEQHIAYWVSEKDKGQSDAFNKGFAKAQNEWLLWLNADDFLCKNALYKLDSFIRKKRNAQKRWFAFNSLYVNPDGICIDAYHGPRWNDFFMRKLGPQVCSATSCFHKSLFNESSGFDLSLYYSMDLDLWVQFMKLGESYAKMQSFFYVFRIHDESKTTSEGLDTKPSEERLRQSYYLHQKNSFFPDIRFLNLWRVIKLFTVFIPTIFYKIFYKNKSLIWWK